MTKRRKQQACKPGSVLRGDLRGEVRLIVFAIYLRRLSPDGSSVLPSTSSGQPSQAPPPTRGCARRSPAVVYLNLQLPRRTADMSPCRWWALAPPSHPCLPRHCSRSVAFRLHEGGRRLFSSALISRRRLLPFSEVGCPVLPGLSSRFRKGRSPATCRRQTVLLLPAAKLQKKCQTRAGSRHSNSYHKITIGTSCRHCSRSEEHKQAWLSSRLFAAFTNHTL